MLLWRRDNNTTRALYRILYSVPYLLNMATTLSGASQAMCPKIARAIIFYAERIILHIHVISNSIPDGEETESAAKKCFLRFDHTEVQVIRVVSARFQQRMGKVFFLFF